MDKADVSNVNYRELVSTIKELEQKPFTYDICHKLASLYVVRDNMYRDTSVTSQNAHTDVLKEYSDILSSYNEYCAIKRDYQLQKTTRDAVITEINIVCKEISEFIHILYSNSDMPEERDAIRNMINMESERI